MGLPPWNFVLDDSRLVTEQWIREGQPPQRFAIPGDPDHSAVYMRAAVVGDTVNIQIDVELVKKKA